MTPYSTLPPEDARTVVPGPVETPAPKSLSPQEQRLRLPNQITVNHGPYHLLGRFFLQADAAAQACGVTLYLHHDLDSLVEANKQLLPQWTPLVPIFNPGRSGMRPDAGFWIEGRNADGEIVATQAARFFPWFETNLEQELSSLRLLYENPDDQKQPGESAEISAPSASRISGRVVFSGAGWYRKDFRGKGLSAIIPRISRVYAYTRFRSDFTFSLVEAILVEKGVLARYGYRRNEPVVRFIGSFRGNLEADLVWMSADELIDELHDYMSSSMTMLERNIDIADTNVRP